MSSFVLGNGDELFTLFSGPKNWLRKVLADQYTNNIFLLLLQTLNVTYVQMQGQYYRFQYFIKNGNSESWVLLVL